MEIKIKYEIGDDVYFFDTKQTGENIIRGTIEHISIGIEKSSNNPKKVDVDITYGINIHQFSQFNRFIAENKLFSNKQELFEYIDNKIK